MSGQTDEQIWERQGRELEVEEADTWVEEQARVVHAAAGLDGPWGTLQPVAWAYCTGRITAASVAEWRQRYDGDPRGVASALATCYPALGPQGPQSVHASAVLAAGSATLVPSTAATPPRPRGVRNAIDELRNSSGGPGLIESASKGGPPPEMFSGSGDMPRVTASGADPSVLANLPWRARLVAAWERDRGRVLQILQDYGRNGPDEVAKSIAELDHHTRVVEHRQQVEQWARTSGVGMQTAMSPDEAAALFPPRLRAN